MNSLATLRQIIWSTISDGQITDEELEKMAAFLRQTQLPPDETYGLRSQTFRQAVEQAVADRRVGAELDMPSHIVARLGISKKEEEWAVEQMALVKGG